MGRESKANPDLSFQNRFGFSPSFIPSGKVGGLHIRRCQGLAVAYYGCTLGALTLKPSNFCNAGVNFPDEPTTFAAGSYRCWTRLKTRGLLPFRRAVLLVAIFAFLGAVLQGQHVMKTIGKQITPLDVRGAFVAQTASAVGMHLFALWGIPVSSSSAIVGAVVGVGLVKGARTISKKTMIIILVEWMLTPCLAAFSAFIVYRLLSSVFA